MTGIQDIQEQPESTLGRKPEQLHDAQCRARPHAPERPHGAGPTEAGRVPRSGAALRREQAEESEVGAEIREREQDEPMPIQELED